MKEKNLTIKYSNHIDKIFNDIGVEIIKDALYTEIRIKKPKRKKGETILISFISPERRTFKIYDEKEKTAFYNGRFWPEVEIKNRL